jgi:hypothetical protein
MTPVYPDPLTNIFTALNFNSLGYQSATRSRAANQQQHPLYGIKFA